MQLRYLDQVLNINQNALRLSNLLVSQLRNLLLLLRSGLCEDLNSRLRLEGIRLGGNVFEVFLFHNETPLFDVLQGVSGPLHHFLGVLLVVDIVFEYLLIDVNDLEELIIILLDFLLQLPQLLFGVDEDGLLGRLQFHQFDLFLTLLGLRLQLHESLSRISFPHCLSIHNLLGQNSLNRRSFGKDLVLFPEPLLAVVDDGGEGNFLALHDVVLWYHYLGFVFLAGELHLGFLELVVDRIQIQIQLLEVEGVRQICVCRLIDENGRQLLLEQLSLLNLLYIQTLLLDRNSLILRVHLANFLVQFFHSSLQLNLYPQNRTALFVLLLSLLDYFGLLALWFLFTLIGRGLLLEGFYLIFEGIYFLQKWSDDLVHQFSHALESLGVSFVDQPQHLFAVNSVVLRGRDLTLILLNDFILLGPVLAPVFPLVSDGLLLQKSIVDFLELFLRGV